MKCCFCIADIFPLHGAGGVHQFMNVDNFVDLLDTEEDATATASTLAVAVSAAAAAVGAQA